MAINHVDLADLQQVIPIVDGNGLPTPQFLRFLNTSIRALRQGVNNLIDVQNAVDAATAAAATANAAASSASTAAASAAQQSALVNSWIVPSSVLSATPSTITVAPHDRHYADGTVKAVNGGTVAATAPGDVDYVRYVDPARAGGTVTYLASTTAPAQTGDTHVVGAITIPATGTASGGRGPVAPGQVQP